MKKFLSVCFMLGLVAGFFSGCSKSEQPAQVDQAGIVVQQPLVDRFAQVKTEAQKLADEAQAQSQINADLASEAAAASAKVAEAQLNAPTAVTEGLNAEAGAMVEGVKSDATEAAAKPVEAITEEVVAAGNSEDLETKVDGVVVADSVEAINSTATGAVDAEVKAVTAPTEVVTEEVVSDGKKEDLETKVDGVVVATEPI